MVPQTELRPKRTSAGLSADLVAVRSGVDRCTLNLAERGLLTLPPSKIDRIADAIDQLAAAKTLVRNYANTVGWPASARL